MKNKKSLLKCAFKSFGFTTEITLDERVSLETTKIFNLTYTVLVLFLVVLGIISDTFENIRVTSDICFTVVGIISYGSLIAVCKMGIAEGNCCSPSFCIMIKSSFQSLWVGVRISVLYP